MLLHSLDHTKLQWPAQLLGRTAAAASQIWTTSRFVAVLSSLPHPVQAGVALLPTPRTSCRGLLLPGDVTTVPGHSQGMTHAAAGWLPALLQVPWARSRCTVQGPAGSQQQGSTYLLLHALLNQHWWPSTPRRCSAPCPGSRCGNRCRKQ